MGLCQPDSGSFNAKFQHNSPKIQHSSHPYTHLIYHKGLQLSPAPDCSPELPHEGKWRIQQVIGMLMYYACAVDPTMLTSINAIAIQQAQPTIKTLKDFTHLLNYCATHPDAVVRYSARDMVLHIHSDVQYHSKDNLGDCHTKHHSVAHHKQVHPLFLHTPHGVLLSVFTITCSLQGCAELGNIQATELDNPERQTAANYITKILWSNPSYSKPVSRSSDIAAAANATLCIT
eukprot:7160790-Ditylum_brightwellii.AAC.1